MPDVVAHIQVVAALAVRIAVAISCVAAVPLPLQGDEQAVRRVPLVSI